MSAIVLGTWKTSVFLKAHALHILKVKTNRISWWIAYKEWYKEMSRMKPSFREGKMIKRNSSWRGCSCSKQYPGLSWLSSNLQPLSTVPNSLMLVIHGGNKGETKVPVQGTSCRKQDHGPGNLNQTFGCSRNSERKMPRNCKSPHLQQSLKMLQQTLGISQHRDESLRNLRKFTWVKAL